MFRYNIKGRIAPSLDGIWAFSVARFSECSGASVSFLYPVRCHDFLAGITGILYLADFLQA